MTAFCQSFSPLPKQPVLLPLSHLCPVTQGVGSLPQLRFVPWQGLPTAPLTFPPVLIKPVLDETSSHQELRSFFSVGGHLSRFPEGQLLDAVDPELFSLSELLVTILKPRTQCDILGNTGTRLPTF